jgi:hypothetical protein
MSKLQQPVPIRGVEPTRPDGLIERLPWRPTIGAASYAATDGAEVAGDRRRRRRQKGEPWRGRFVDLLG